jgi:hypothetical protein
MELEFKGALFKIGLLASIPHLVETAFNFIIIYFALSFPPFIALCFSLCMTAVAPGVIVPLMIGLMKDGYGMKKMIPIKIIASSTIENLAVIVLFGIFSGLGLNQVSSVQVNIGVNIGFSILEIVVGILGGGLFGFLGFMFKPKEL